MQNGIIPVSSKSLQHLINESSRINRLVDDLHDLSLLESQEMSFNPELIEIAPIIERLISSYREQLNQKSISVSIKAETPSISAYVDVDRITQVFINLIANTLKYTDSPGELSIMVNQMRDKILIRWMDSGPGVKTEDLEQLFSRFYRADPSRIRKNDGHCHERRW